MRYRRPEGEIDQAAQVSKEARLNRIPAPHVLQEVEIVSAAVALRDVWFMICSSGEERKKVDVDGRQASDESAL